MPPHHTPAEVCGHLEHYVGPAEHLLRGAHLRVLEMVWPPYADRDPTAKHGWVGYDIDLLERIAKHLEFTFEIHDGGELQPGESYTDLLVRTMDTADLWLSWWLRDRERMNATAMLFGHVDASPVLVAPPPIRVNEEQILLESLWTFMMPFSWDLWLCLATMVVLSGCVDWLLERGSGGRLTSSIYEYFGGVLWGGFQDPNTRLSAMYQVCVSLTILIVVSAYTANLASYMTLKRIPAHRFGSVEELIASKQSVCTVGSYAMQSTLEKLYPTLAFDVSHSANGDIATALVEQQCSASIVPHIDYDGWLSSGQNCELSTVGTSLYFETGGWVTNLNSTLCVQRSIESALHFLQASGVINELFRKWMPNAPCDAPGQAEGDGDEDDDDDASSTDGNGNATSDSLPATGRRRLAHRPRRVRRTGGATHRIAGRRLSATSVSAVSGASSAEGDGEEDPETMTPRDFFGIFVFWILATFGILFIRIVLVMHEHRTERLEAQRREATKKRPSQIAAMRRATAAGISKRGHSVADALFGNSDKDNSERHKMLELGVPTKLDINNHSAMLRHLIVRT